MLIRLAQTNDLPSLMALLQRVIPLMRAAGNFQWDNAYPNTETFAHDIELGELWVAEPQDGVLAGVAAITTNQTPEYAQAGLDISETAIVVHRLAVDPTYRGAGIASAFMQQAETVARTRGIPILRIDTNTQNEATQRLFPKLGYRLAGEIGLNFRPGLRFLCYEKRLSPATHLAAIALGSNLNSEWGDRAANLRHATEQIAKLGEVRSVSTFYDTAPVGYTDQPRFLNGALLLTTELEPLALMHALLAIERTMGRDRTTAPAKGPRIIDLDLLLMDDIVLTTKELTLPHPAMASRGFVLEPLAEIAPSMLDPLSGQTVKELLIALSEK